MSPAAAAKGNITSRAQVLRDTDTYKRIRSACCPFAAASIDLDAHALLIAQTVTRARAASDGADRAWNR